MICHHRKIVLEFVNQVLYFWVLDFNNERVRQFGVLCRYYKIISLRNQHFDIVHSVSQIMITNVQCFFFDYLVCSKMSRLYVGVLTGSISSSFLIECISYTLTLLLLFNDEIWLSLIAFIFDQWVLAYVFQYFLAAFFFFLPFWDVIIGWFILQSF